MKYLQHYAETEISLLADFPYHYEHVLTIPAYKEESTLLDSLQALETEAAVLVILLVNAPDNASSKHLQETQALATHFREKLPLLLELAPYCSLLALTKTKAAHVLLVERCWPDTLIPAQEGVGLARKIACDLATYLIHTGKIRSPWIHNTDADVLLPPAYFSAAEKLNPDTTAAALFPFRHESNEDAELQLAMDLYELSLHYYVEALAWAGSPFAFHTIGSTLLINHRNYAQVRGFPKRAAGEDFYLLNKLAKTGLILSLDQAEITLSSRVSDRVPFGTGPALKQITAYDDPMQEYLFYHPEVFLYLRDCLQGFRMLWQHKTEYGTDGSFWQRNFSTRLDQNLLHICLQDIGMDKALQHAFNHSQDYASFQRHLHNWFDAFRTLKFIHALRRRGLGSVNFSELLHLLAKQAALAAALPCLSSVKYQGRLIQRSQLLP